MVDGSGPVVTSTQLRHRTGYPGDVTPEANHVLEKVRDLIDEVRPTCLWYLREDYYPETVAQALRVLDAVERHGDLSAFRRAAELRIWLSHPSSAQSVDS